MYHNLYICAIYGQIFPNCLICLGKYLSVTLDMLHPEEIISPTWFFATEWWYLKNDLMSSSVANAWWQLKCNTSPWTVTLYWVCVHRTAGIMVLSGYCLWKANNTISLFEQCDRCALCWRFPKNHFTALSRWTSTLPFSARQCTSPNCLFAKH